MDTRDEDLVVVGGGQAAAQLIDVARRKGFEGSITLITDEPLLPYQRPPLSKVYLMGNHDREWLLYRNAIFYVKYRVSVLLGRRVIAIDRTAKLVVLDDGQAISYSKLALTVGARARRLDVPGADHPRVFYIRSVADSERLRACVGGSQRVVIVGGGFIGLEVAAMFRQKASKVTLVCTSERLIQRLGVPDVAAHLSAVHIRHGVDLLMNTEVVGFRHVAGDAVETLLADGTARRADIVIVGIGAIPNTEIAQDCGITCDDGIVVDEEARTNDEAIFAAGDCTNHPNALLGRRLRLETVHNAVEQGRTAGESIAGNHVPYTQIPWVWSDQYEIRLQSVGVAEGYDRITLRGNPATESFSFFYFSGEQLLAVNSFNHPLVFGIARRLLNGRVAITQAQAANSDFNLATLSKTKSHLEFDVPWPTKAEKAQAALLWGSS